MIKTFFFTLLFLSPFVFPIFGQVNPYSVTTNDSIICDGENVTLSVQFLPGSIMALDCPSSINTGNLFATTAASGVSSSIPYTGGNGGLYNGQTVNSTGVTGLTATLLSGVFNNGSGSLIYTISGTPTVIGTASFALTIGGQSCSLDLYVNAAQPPFPSGSVFCNGITTYVNDVTNPTTGKTWMDRNLGASQVATSSTDVSGYGDFYQWGRRSDGHQCAASTTIGSLSSVDVPVHGFFIIAPTSPFDWRSPQNTNLWQGVNGTNNPCPSGYRIPTETEINTERLSWSSNNNSGALASSLKLPMPGFRISGNGSFSFVGTFGFYWTSTISNTLSRHLSYNSSTASISTNNRAIGGSVRCIKETIGTIGALNCGSSTITGNLIVGASASSVTVSVPYTGGNGGFHATQSLTSNGVTGLTATKTQGLFTSSSGSLVYTITGTPSASGTASFALTIGGQSCTLNVSVYGEQPSYPVSSVFCSGITTVVNDVTNPTTGKTWMDRNLGATRAAITSTDANSYGDLYQWGRRSDGHQCRTSTTTSTLSSIDVPANGNFILASTTPFNWRSPQNTNLWQGISGTNNPCPTGYRLPTETEINAERLSWTANTSVGAFDSPLKFPMTGVRRNSNGLLLNVGAYGAYWSSTVSGANSPYLDFSSSVAFISTNYRALGLAVRCIKETIGSIAALNCGSSTLTGNLISGSASSVSASVPYTGGNGGFYTAQSVSSTGITGLTASISQGLFASGVGNLIYVISGTPTLTGTANFELTIGGQSCTLSIVVYGIQPAYPVGSVFCNGATIVNDVTNPSTGKTWMDRNLGASQVATSSSDANSFGDLYQWGRRSDGHQCRTSTTTTVLSSSDQPANNRFITINSGNYDWRSPQNINLWQGLSGTNNPCPNGYRLPTETELNTERLSWIINTSVGALTSPLKLPMAGYRFHSNGSIVNTGTNGYYWSSSVSGTNSNFLAFEASNAYLNPLLRAYGTSVRCIKEYNGTTSALNCESYIITGNLISNTPASSVSISIPYTGGNGGFYASQSITSTGVTGLTATLSAGNFTNDAGNLVYTITGTPSADGNASFAISIGGQSCTLNLTVVPSSITSLSCSSVTNDGYLIDGTLANNVSASVPYTGGNGGFYASQSITSTGVTGLTASISQGLFANGSGNLVFEISGTPNISGIASFAINIGGQNCSLDVVVYGVQPSYPTGTLPCFGTSNTIVNDVTNPTTGRTWMDRNLGASQAPTSLDDANAYGDLYQWGRIMDRHQCRSSETIGIPSYQDRPSNSGRFIADVNWERDWRLPQNNNLWQGINGINNPCPFGYRLPTDIEFNDEISSWTSETHVGAFDSPLKWIGDGYRNGDNGGLVNAYGGNFSCFWSSTVNGIYAKYLEFNYNTIDQINIYSSNRINGYTVRCIKEIIGSVGSIDCDNSVVSHNLISYSPASGVTASIPYSGGNGGYYPAQSYSSTGVTGLVLSISQGLFSSGSGNLIYEISGTTNASGTAIFELTIGGQTCSLNLSVTVGQIPTPSTPIYCNGIQTIVNDVTNPTTGKTWMDRNLGATQLATSSTDVNSYGDLYQWGRRSDGHQCRSSFTTTTLSSTDQPVHGDFITVLYSTSDWRSPQNSSLWQGMYGINNPCPSGYRLPTETEFTAESSSWSSNNANGAITSPLKLPMAGFRYRETGTLAFVGTSGFYWSSTISSTQSYYFRFTSSSINSTINDRGLGVSVRCIKESLGSIGALNCENSTLTGNLISNELTNNVSVSVPYTGGLSGYYNGQTISSTGITGLTATLEPGVFNSGLGSLIFNIIGTPSAVGTVSFELNVGGQSCTLNLIVYGAQPSYPVGSVFCTGHPTVVNEVTNPTTGRTWMDRNMGAIQVATSSTDVNSYGDLYQWGRAGDGHQCRTSTTTSTFSSSDQPGNGNFIIATLAPNEDWRSPQNPNLWQVSSETNNPCPTGFRIPTYTEINNERSSWSVGSNVGAMSSPLKLTMAGYRLFTDGSLVSVGTNGRYWHSTLNATDATEARSLSFNSSTATYMNNNRANGISVRCIKEINGTIGSLNCNNADITGSFSSGIAISNVLATIPYTGGNGGLYETQSISSTGVTGLTASIIQNLFAIGTGNLVFSINGTPSSNGTASFALTIGGQTCILNVNVFGNQPNYPIGSVFCNEIITIVNDVTNPTTGKTWMDRNLGASRVATSSTDVYSYGDLYQWGRTSDGHQCRSALTTSSLSSNNSPTHGLFILVSSTPFDWRSPQNSSLWQGVNGTNNPCPIGYRLPTETEINAERSSWSQNNSNGAIGSPLKFPMAGLRNSSSGSVTNVDIFGYYWSNTISSNNSRYLDFHSSNASMISNSRAFGFSVRCLKEPIGTIGALNCGSATVTGNLSIGAASSVTVSVPYTGGNGGYYASQSVTSTGVTGLTASIAQGLFTSSTGSLVYSITGTPSSSGIASFALTIGGQSCTLNVTVYGVQPSYPVASVFCSGIATVVNDVTNPTTGKTWMDRNLGATRAATSSTDANSYGDLYQWGRRSDGHQCRTSLTTSTLSSVDVPSNSRYIMVNATPYDWRTPQNTNLWQGVNGTNNPCPTGYRLPTDTELNTERLSWSANTSVGALASPLKLSMNGYRNNGDASLNFVGFNGYFWSSTASGIYSRYMTFTSSSSSLTVGNRSNGNAVRCIKETIGSIGALDCGNAIVTGNLISGLAASGVSISVPYTGGNGGFFTSQSFTSTGVTGLTASVSQGLFASGSGNLTYNITGTPSTSGIASFSLNIGGSTCTITCTVSIAGTITSLLCASVTNTGVIIEDIATSGVSFTIPYLGGDGGVYSSQTLNSVGNTGLTASLNSGAFLNGNGSLNYSISGTSTSASDVSFIVSIGGQTCNLSVNVLPNLSPTYPANSVFCANGSTDVIDVTNPTTGKTWMDRNLGASQVATSSADVSAYGDLYQWGRRSDGHQCRSSVTTSTLSSVDQPAHGNFILSSNAPNDWRSPENTNLWQGINGTNNPCPTGYRLPTETEVNAEGLSWSQNNSIGAFASPLKLPTAGFRNSQNGQVTNDGIFGNYWSSTVSSTNTRYLEFYNSNAIIGSNDRARGYSVRCIKN